MVTNGNLGSIKYLTLSSNSHLNKPFEVIKEQWGDLEPDKIYLAKIFCGSEFIALIQTYGQLTHGSALITSYGLFKPIYAVLRNTTWTEYSLITNTDLNPEVYIVPKPSDTSTFTFSNRSFQVSVRKSGKVVTIQLNISGSMAAVSDFVTAFTIPQKYKPLTDIVINYVTQNTAKAITLFITQNGEVKFTNFNTSIDDWLCRQCITYVTDN